MNKQLKNFFAALAVGVLLMRAPLSAEQATNNTYINHATRFAISPPLRDLAKLPQPLQYGFHEAQPIHRFPTHLAAERVGDLAEQNSVLAGSSAYSIGANFIGLGHGFPGWYGTYYPPDSTMAVGDSQIVQWVNVAYTVCQKASPYTCGSAIVGNTLWKPLGGICAQHNNGDIIVQWDVAAHRWLLAQNVFVSPYGVCVAVSTSPDATGSYYLYEFPVVGTGDPDYPKWGIWSTGYFQSYNSLFGSICLECAVACAYNSAKMLVGDKTAEQICHAYVGGDNYLLPADQDSPTPPPSGQDEFYVGSLGAVDNSHLSLYSVHINNQSDWTQGATFTGDGNSQVIAIAPFTPSCNSGTGLGGDCVPQKGVTDRLDSLGSLMYRFAYWNDAASDSPNFTLSASPASLSIEQGNQGTSTITSTISGGFNSPISFSASGVPSGAAAIFNPATIPTPGSGNSTMTITVGVGVPAGTYPIPVTGNGGGTQQSTTVTLTVTAPEQPNFTISASPASLTVQQGNQGTSAITTTISGDFNSSIGLSASGVPSGTTVSFNPNPIPAPGSGSSTMTITVGSTLVGTYPITVTGNGGGVQQNATVTLTVTSSGGLQSFGFDFRSTTTFVTDPPGDTYVLSNTAYPTKGNGVTFGWVKTSLVQARNRNANLDPRLAGINFVNNGSPATFYVDLPSAGTYDLSLAMGDAGYSQCSVQCQVQFLDGSTVLATVSGGSIAAGYFYDATGKKWSAAAWPTSNVSQQVTLAGTRLTVVVGTNQATGTYTTIAYLGVTLVSDTLSLPHLADQGSPEQHWLVNFDVTASGGNIGPRWMEITAPSSNVPVTALSVLQQGTYAPDGNWRWMGSVARDKAGDILLGYSESCGDNCPGGTPMYPSIYIAGRQLSDPLGNLEGEVEVIAGGGSQPDTSNRWGDYSTVRIDQDGCTFWYTQEYYLATQTDHWSTQIASAKFQNCN